MSSLAASIEGIGFWAPGLPDWAAARAFATGGEAAGDASGRPAPTLLPPNERRRAPESVAVALHVAMAACESAGRPPAGLPGVFASTHGDLAITDYMCATLAEAPQTLSPTKFHNSVHNAAAGYWTIGAGCVRPATALSAHTGSFAQGLLESLAQLAAGDADAVLLVGYDTAARGPLGGQARSTGLLGGALVLGAAGGAGRVRLRATLADGAPTPGNGPLARHAAGNAMAPMLPLFDALANGDDLVSLEAGGGRVLRLELARE
ncbi:beta-ketoacyl synthase chain length factor [Luteimonas pelagia]